MTGAASASAGRLPRRLSPAGPTARAGSASAQPGHAPARPTHRPTALPDGVGLRELRSVTVMRTRGAPGPTLTPPPPGWKRVGPARSADRLRLRCDTPVSLSHPERERVHIQTERDSGRETQVRHASVGVHTRERERERESLYIQTGKGPACSSAPPPPCWQPAVAASGPLLPLRRFLDGLG
jgi:hypothetical protein